MHNEHKTLELQMVNGDYIKSAVELLRWHYDGERTLLYRADQVIRLLHTFDGHWREAYRRVMNNAEKLKKQTLHSAVHEILASNVEKEPKATNTPLAIILPRASQRFIMLGPCIVENSHRDITCLIDGRYHPAEVFFFFGAAWRRFCKIV